MSLTTKQLVINIDDYVKKTLISGGEEELLMSLFDIMSDIKQVMDSSTQHEIDSYCDQYDGFFHVMKLLEDIATGIADGSITVPK